MLQRSGENVTGVASLYMVVGVLGGLGLDPVSYTHLTLPTNA